MSESVTPAPRSYWPLGVLGAGGVVTVAWIGSLAWMAWETLSWAVN